MEGESITPLSSSFDNGNFPKLSWSGQKIPTLSSSKDVHKEYQQIECLKDHLRDRNEWSDNSGTYSGNPSLEYIGKHDYSLKSCLVVEYYKQNQGDKWLGEFKLVWSLSENDGTETFITVFNAKTENGKLKTDASIYLIKKGGNDQKKILANYKQESVVKEITDSNNLSNYFPKSGTQTKNRNQDDYWGFNPEINKICKNTGECSDITESQTLTSKQWKWSKSDSNGTPVTDFSSNFDTWFSNSFDNKWNTVKEELKKLKGNWNKG